MGIIIGLAAAACIFSVYCCCKVASDADDEMERMMQEKEKENTND